MNPPFSIHEHIKKILQFVPSGKCPYCDTDVLFGIVITEKTEIVTGCPNKYCKRSFVE